MRVSAILVVEPVRYNCYHISRKCFGFTEGVAKESELGNARKFT